MADAPAATASKRAAPGDFLRGVVGRPVSVRLQSGAEYRGVLVCLDGYMNIALEQTEEYVDGALRSKLGDCFLRGNNGARPARLSRTLAVLPNPGDS
jgi:U6 snRNA-associated Sm-like protein LSm6